ncbi:acetylornithine aminotransferase [Serendipita sp. 396]|nr:acetylornithine aminotransferase [Serendipita sp. 396]
MIHTSNVWYNEWAGELAKLLVETTKQHGGLGFAPGGKDQRGEGGAKVFFSNSGTEANEGALKFARKYAKEFWANEMTNGVGAARKWEDSTKTRVIHFTNAFHGRSMGSLSATANPKYQLPFTPLIPGFELVKYGDINGFRATIGPDTCAVIVEPIQGEGGVFEGSEEFFKTLRAECDRFGAVLIFDEIQCGLFRSGNMWSHSTFPLDCHPDIVTMAKPLANGFPIGAIMVRDHIAKSITPGSHGTTFGGSVFATRLAHHVLTRLSSPTLTAHINQVSAHLQSRLSKLQTHFPTLITEPARGRGLIRGIPFTDQTIPGKLVDAARQRGVLLLTAGKDAVRLVPSLNVERAEIDFAVDVIESILGTLSVDQ